MAATALVIVAYMVRLGAAHQGVHGREVEQTEWQKSLLHSVGLASKQRSSEASAQLLERLASKDVRSQLEVCSPEVAKLTPAALAQKVRDEVAVAEVISGFPSISMEGNMCLQEGMSGPHFFESNWQVGVRQKFNFTKGLAWYAIQDAVETKLYGMRPFQTEGEPKSMREAAERAPYCTLNLHRVDAGSPLYGDISAVFSPRVTSVSSVVSAVDTGGWSAMCNQSSEADADVFLRGLSPHAFGQPVNPVWPPPGYNPNCSVYKHFTDLGTSHSFDHLFLINEAYWNSSLGHLLCRLLGPPEKTPIVGADLVHYWEVLPAAQLTYPLAVKFIIATFTSLFGTKNGRRLQTWCKEQGWVLIWSLGLNTGDDYANFWTAVGLNISIPSNNRLADPQVLGNTTAATNMSLPQNAIPSFADAWTKVEASRRAAYMNNRTILKEEWAEAWKALDHQMPSTLHLSALRAGSCADVEGCIGTTPEGDCFCYMHASKTEDSVII